MALHSAYLPHAWNVRTSSVGPNVCPRRRIAKRSLLFEPQRCTLLHAYKPERVLYTESRLRDGRTSLKIGVPDDVWSETCDEVISDISHRVAREGKLSPDMDADELLENVGGAWAINRLAMERTMNKALVRYGERARGKPELMDITSPETGGVTLEIAFEMEPEVTWAKPYQSLKILVQGSRRPSPLDVEEKLMELASALEPVTGRECKVGDVASIVLDFCSYGTEDRFPEMTPWSSLEVDTSKREALNCYLPGLAGRVVGLTVGESARMEMVLPEAFIPFKLAGCKVTLTITLTGLQARIPPRHKDEVWSRLLVPGQTVSLLRQGVKAGLVRETELAKLQRTWAALKKEVAVIVVPHTITPSLRQLVASRLFRQDLLHLQDQTNLAPGQIVKLAEQEDIDGYASRYADRVEEETKAQLGLEEIARREDILPTDDEIEARYVAAVREAAKTAPGSTVYDRYGRQQIGHCMVLDNVVGWLRQFGRITETSPDG